VYICGLWAVRGGIVDDPQHATKETDVSQKFLERRSGGVDCMLISRKLNRVRYWTGCSSVGKRLVDDDVVLQGTKCGGVSI
jgi:hypothetical protein